jgi:hypothetical protein
VSRPPPSSVYPSRRTYTKRALSGRSAVSTGETTTGFARDGLQAVACEGEAHGEDLRPTWPVILVRGFRDEKKPAVVMSNTSTDLQDFTGATGLKPATSGVTGRSWRLRADWGRAGIPGASWPFRPCRCGDCRVLAGAFDRLPRDERGMRRCLGRERSRRRDALHRAAFSGAISDGAWWVSRGFLGKPASVIRIRSE